MLVKKFLTKIKMLLVVTDVFVFIVFLFIPMIHYNMWLFEHYCCVLLLKRERDGESGVKERFVSHLRAEFVFTFISQELVVRKKHTRIG